LAHSCRRAVSRARDGKRKRGHPSSRPRQPHGGRHHCPASTGSWGPRTHRGAQKCSQHFSRRTTGPALSRHCHCNYLAIHHRGYPRAGSRTWRGASSCCEPPRTREVQAQAQTPHNANRENEGCGKPGTQRYTELLHSSSLLGTHPPGNTAGMGRQLGHGKQ